MDQPTLALLEDGLRHIKGFVGVLDRWVAMQKGRVTKSSQGADGRKADEPQGQ